MCVNSVYIDELPMKQLSDHIQGIAGTFRSKPESQLASYRSSWMSTYHTAAQSSMLGDMLSHLSHSMPRTGWAAAIASAEHSNRGSD